MLIHAYQHKLLKKITSGHLWLPGWQSPSICDYQADSHLPSVITRLTVTFRLWLPGWQPPSICDYQADSHLPSVITRLTVTFRLWLPGWQSPSVCDYQADSHLPSVITRLTVTFRLWLPGWQSPSVCDYQADSHLPSVITRLTVTFREYCHTWHQMSSVWPDVCSRVRSYMTPNVLRVTRCLLESTVTHDTKCPPCDQMSAREYGHTWHQMSSVWPDVCSRVLSHMTPNVLRVTRCLLESTVIHDTKCPPCDQMSAREYGHTWHQMSSLTLTWHKLTLKTLRHVKMTTKFCHPLANKHHCHNSQVTESSVEKKPQPNKIWLTSNAIILSVWLLDDVASATTWTS